MNPQQQRIQNDLDGLQLIHKFSWLRSHELGPLLWPNARHARQQANRLIRTWRERRLIIERTLPDRAGRAVVLSAAGVRLLVSNGIHAATGKDFGKMDCNIWTPPLTWRHDLIAIGVLVDLYLKGFTVLPEAEIKRNPGQLTKLPDGIAHRGNQVIWIEVEHARKSGASMRHLAQALCSTAQGSTPPILGMHPTHVMVAFVAAQADERGYSLSHRERVTKAIAATAYSAVPVTWASCSVRSAGVCTVDYIDDLIGADRAAAIQRRLDLCGWRHDAGTQVCHYGTRAATIWQDEEANSWAWQVDDFPAERVSTVSEAKRRCAEIFANS